jgi:murein DD-endopeptidase MepM/ murein hydrolase activator NlpD
MKYVLLLISIACFTITIGVSHDFAETPQELQAQIDQRAAMIQQLEKDIKTYTELKNKSSAEAQTLSGFIKDLQKQVDIINLDIKKSQTAIDKHSLEIKKIGNAITGNEQKLQNMHLGLAESLFAQYQADDINIIENFLGGKSILASAQDVDHLRILQENIKETVTDVTAVKEDLEINKTEEQKKKEDLETEKEKLRVKQKSLDLNKEAQKKELEITKNQESNYKKIVDDTKKKKAAFEKELFEYEAKLKYVLDPKSIPKAGSSALSWPVDDVYITQQFGKTNASKRLYVSGTHNGVDFRASIGTPVKSAGNGKVAGVGNTDADCPRVSFGKWILIKYDNGLATTYGHLSKIEVSAGQVVTSGQVVGYSGNTGYSTGPHLHVSTYAADAVNPVTRPSASCPGVSMTMPVSAISAYLDPLVYFPKK